jgi:hypothetical protein
MCAGQLPPCIGLDSGRSPAGTGYCMSFDMKSNYPAEPAPGNSASAEILPRNPGHGVSPQSISRGTGILGLKKPGAKNH